MAAPSPTVVDVKKKKVIQGKVYDAFLIEQGQPHFKTRTVSYLALDADLAAVRVGNPLYDRET